MPEYEHPERVLMLFPGPVSFEKTIFSFFVCDVYCECVSIFVGRKEIK